jgi:hypothetical protein
MDKQPVLFDFMAAGDILDLLFSVEVYLLRKGPGSQIDPSRLRGDGRDLT